MSSFERRIVGVNNPVGVINNPSRSWKRWKVVLAEDLPESAGGSVFNGREEQKAHRAKCKAL